MDLRCRKALSTEVHKTSEQWVQVGSLVWERISSVRSPCPLCFGFRKRLAVDEELGLALLKEADESPYLVTFRQRLHVAPGQVRQELPVYLY